MSGLSLGVLLSSSVGVTGPGHLQAVTGQAASAAPGLHLQEELA